MIDSYSFFGLGKQEFTKLPNNVYLLGIMSEKIPIAPLGEFTEGRTFKFVIPDKNGTKRDAFAFRRGENFFAYYNECSHICLPLDWDDNDFFTLDHQRLMCKHHGAEYLHDTGECVEGPCVGARLKKIEILVDDGVVVVKLNSASDTNPLV